MNKTAQKAGQVILDIVLILIGSALSAFAMDLFLIPNQIAPGGASGLALVINFLINNVISTGILIIIINVPLFLIGLKIFGKIFVIKSLLGTVSFSILVDVLKPMALTFEDKWFRTNGVEHNDLLLFSIYGGVLLGIGFGLVMRAGSSTGGSSMGAQILNRVLPNVTTGVWILIIDAVVLLFAAFAFKNIIYALYSVIVIWISTTLMDIMVGGINHAKAVYIISEDADKIKQEVLYKLKRGVTTLVGKGAYSGNEKNILLCVVQHAQIHELKRIVSNIDERAFVILTDAKEVLGEGFRR